MKLLYERSLLHIRSHDLKGYIISKCNIFWHLLMINKTCLSHPSICKMCILKTTIGPTNNIFVLKFIWHLKKKIFISVLILRNNYKNISGMHDHSLNFEMSRWQLMRMRMLFDEITIFLEPGMGLLILWASEEQLKIFL